MTCYVMGHASNQDRVAYLEVVSEKTTASSTDYTFPTEVVIPAGKLSADFKVVLNRTDALGDHTVRLYLQVIESEDFKVGVMEQNHFLFKWNDVLSKPINWDIDLTEFFGNFSLVKYRFIIDTVGTGDFDLATMSWAEMNNYKIVMKTALTE